MAQKQAAVSAIFLAAPAAQPDSLVFAQNSGEKKPGLKAPVAAAGLVLRACGTEWDLGGRLLQRKGTGSRLETTGHEQHQKQGRDFNPQLLQGEDMAMPVPQLSCQRNGVRRKSTFHFQGGNHCPETWLPPSSFFTCAAFRWQDLNFQKLKQNLRPGTLSYRILPGQVFVGRIHLGSTQPASG